MWVDEDPFDDDGKPKNGWKKAATYEDKGVENLLNLKMMTMKIEE